MKKYYLNNLSHSEYKDLLIRPSIDLEKIFKTVKPILNDIKKNGLQAALKYAQKFDGFEDEDLIVAKKEFDEAEKSLDKEIRTALKGAAKNFI